MGDPDRGPTWLSIMATALLFVSSLWSPNPRNTLAMRRGYHSGSLEAGLAGAGSTHGLLPTPQGA